MNSKVPPGELYTGLSGLALPIPKYKYPDEFKQSSRLTYYGSQFNSIEINRSFYVLLNGKTVAKWSNEVPENFKFTFKLWKQITHTKGLEFNASDVVKFMSVIGNVGHRKACILIQFPGSLKSHSIDQLRHLLEEIQNVDHDRSWKVAVEFRDNGWYSEETYDVVRAYGSTVVMHDKIKRSSQYTSVTSGNVYLRFHGPEGNYRGSYDEAFLNEYASYINEWLLEGKSVFVYFNNTMGDAFANSKRLRSSVIV
jgi:uncharacterized protein YecE (DUF72 family)